MKISVPDLNVLLALLAASHSHHSKALEWFEKRDADSVAICRVTQMGLLRLLTNPKALPAGCCSIPRAWDVVNELLADTRVFFESEPPELEATWTALMTGTGVGPGSWTDAYLAAFAIRHDYEFVTFDRGFTRWSDLSVLTTGTG